LPRLLPPPENSPACTSAKRATAAEVGASRLLSKRWWPTLRTLPRLVATR